MKAVKKKLNIHAELRGDEMFLKLVAGVKTEKKKSGDQG